MPRSELRVRLPDRPGSLGVLALTLGRAGANIESFGIVEVAGRCAVDQLVIELPAGGEDQVRELLAALPGVHVEALRPVPRRPGFTSPLELVEAMVSGPPDGALQALVDGIPSAMGVTWSVVLAPRSPQPERIVASVGAPSLVGMATPWWPVGGAVALPTTNWAPARWRVDEGEGTVAAAPLERRGLTVLAVRASGPSFRRVELDQLATLARVAGGLDSATSATAPRGGSRV